MLAAGCGADTPATQSRKEAREEGLAADGQMKIKLLALRATVLACAEREGTFSACDTRRELGEDALLGLPYGRSPGRLRVADAGRETFTVAGLSRSGNDLRIERRVNGAERRTCTRPGVGICDARGRW